MNNLLGYTKNPLSRLFSVARIQGQVMYIKNNYVNCIYPDLTLMSLLSPPIRIFGRPYRTSIIFLPRPSNELLGYARMSFQDRRNDDTNQESPDVTPNQYSLNGDWDGLGISPWLCRSDVVLASWLPSSLITAYKIPVAHYTGALYDPNYSKLQGVPDLAAC